MALKDDDIELLLLKQIAEGDEYAFKAIYDLYRDRFYGVALKLSSSNYIAEEILQEVFISIWRSRALLARVENPAPYLFSIFYNCLKQSFRKEAQEKRLKMQIVSGDSEKEFPFDEEELSREDQFRLFDKAISGLPPQQAMVYKLSKEEGLSREEVAQKMGISSNTVKNHLADAIRTIKNTARQLGLLLVFFSFFCRIW
jgi:RNA polymerase sigma-70 factor (family 1)